MAGPRGYNSYRGRTSPGKILLTIVLIAVILVAVGFLILQKYLVYDESGTPHLRLPDSSAEETVPTKSAASSSAGGLNITIDEPAAPATLQIQQLTGDPSAWQAQVASFSAADQGGFCITMKEPDGTVNYASAVSGTRQGKQAAAVSAALPALLGGDSWAVARISCLLDPVAAKADTEGMGLKNTGGYLFYDGNNENWLDPAKPAAQAYLASLVKECAALGFNEILLTDVSYPTAGKLNKIAYGTADRAAALGNFLAAMRTALTDYPDVKLSVEIPAAVFTAPDEDAGLSLAQLVGHVDRICAATTAWEAPTLAQALSAAGGADPMPEFLPELSGETLEGSYLLLA